MFEAKLIAIYSYVAERYDQELKYHCTRFSNNNKPVFSDVEALTIYLYCVHEEKRFLIKDMHRFTKCYLSSWFPKLPSYQAFNNRINRLCSALEPLFNKLISDNKPPDVDTSVTLTDSVPVITCSAKRKAKVAGEIVNKGVSPTKGFYYYGLKIHLSGYRIKDTLPYPYSVVVSDAAASDLRVLKEHDSHYQNTTIYGDKAYVDQPYFAQLADAKGVDMLTPIRGVRGQSDWNKQFNKAGNDLFSTAVSTVRQPIESLFNWLIEHTDIQRASKVRSTKGLLVHVYGKLAAAFCYLIFNP